MTRARVSYSPTAAQIDIRSHVGNRGNSGRDAASRSGVIDPTQTLASEMSAHDAVPTRAFCSKDLRMAAITR